MARHAAASVADYLDQAPQGLVHGASPWLYGMARTELEKVVIVGVWFESLQKPGAVLAGSGELDWCQL